MLLVRGTYCVVLFSSKVDGVDVYGRIDRCFARHKTAKAAPCNGENQPERLEAVVPWGLYPGTGVLWPMSAADVRCFLRRISPVPTHGVEHSKYAVFLLTSFC